MTELQATNTTVDCAMGVATDEVPPIFFIFLFTFLCAVTCSAVAVTAFFAPGSGMQPSWLAAVALAMTAVAIVSYRGWRRKQDIMCALVQEGVYYLKTCIERGATFAGVSVRVVAIRHKDVCIEAVDSGRQLWLPGKLFCNPDTDFRLEKLAAHWGGQYKYLGRMVLSIASGLTCAVLFLTVMHRAPFWVQLPVGLLMMASIVMMVVYSGRDAARSEMLSHIAAGRFLREGFDGYTSLDLRNKFRKGA